MLSRNEKEKETGRSFLSLLSETDRAGSIVEMDVRLELERKRERVTVKGGEKERGRGREVSLTR